MPAPTARTILVRALRQSRAQDLALSAALVCCACGGNEPPLPQRPAPTYGIPRQRPTNTATTPQTREQEGAQNRALGGDALYPRFADPPLKAAEKAEPAEQKADEQTAKKGRDYSAELSTLLGQSAPGCLAAAPPTTSSVSIQVTAQVMATGTVSRAEVQGAGLPAPALACIKKAAGAFQLRSPVEDAPRAVQAQLTLQTQSPAKAPQPPAAEEDRADERDGNPRDSKVHHVDDNPPEVEQKLYEDTREAPEVPDPKDEPPADNHTD